MKQFISSTILFIIVKTVAFSQSICFSSPEVHFTGTGDGIYGAVADDFNHDGFIDLVTSNSTGDNISIMLGEGNGDFGSPVNYATGDVASGMNKGDFNNDGNVDVVVTNQAGHTVSILLCNGDGTFDTAVNFPILSGQPQVVVAYDFNVDSILDLAVGCWSGALIILLGDGTGNFTELNTYSASSGMGSITIADFNSDSIPDIVLPGGLSYYMYFLQGMGGGNFAMPVPLLCNDRSTFLMVADLNNDTLPDIIAASHLDTSVTLFFNTGNFTFDSTVYYAFPGPWSDPSFVTLTDFNGDSIEDLLVTFYTLSGFAILPGTSNGNFSSAQDFNGVPGSIIMIAKDLNQDGMTDIIAPDHSFPSYNVRLNCTPSGISQLSGYDFNASISPNPFTTFTTITLTNYTAPFNVQLFDELGREAPLQYHTMQQGNNTTLTIDRGELQSGMYFLSITSKEKREVVKLMVTPL